MRQHIDCIKIDLTRNLNLFESFKLKFPGQKLVITMTAKCSPEYCTKRILHIYIICVYKIGIIYMIFIKQQHKPPRSALRRI